MYNLSLLRIKECAENDLIDSKYGFDRLTQGEKTAYLINMHSSEVAILAILSVLSILYILSILSIMPMLTRLSTIQCALGAGRGQASVGCSGLLLHTGGWGKVLPPFNPLAFNPF